jgi:hypothetical protein
MKLHKIEYPTEAMARAFMQGVEFAQNEHVSVHEPRKNALGKWDVYVHLWNQEGNTEVCPACIDSYETLYGAEKAKEFARALRDEEVDLGGGP